MVNRENMEKWINALEAYDRQSARGMFHAVHLDGTVRMCAMGIGMDVMEPGILVRDKRRAIDTFEPWLGLGISDRGWGVALNPDDSSTKHVVDANDRARQSPWTIAQRLRETYLKEEQ